MLVEGVERWTIIVHIGWSVNKSLVVTHISLLDVGAGHDITTNALGGLRKGKVSSRDLQRFVMWLHTWTIVADTGEEALEHRWGGKGLFKKAHVGHIINRLSLAWIGIRKSAGMAAEASSSWSVEGEKCEILTSVFKQPKRLGESVYWWLCHHWCALAEVDETKGWDIYVYVCVCVLRTGVHWLFKWWIENLQESRRIKQQGI